MTMRIVNVWWDGRLVGELTQDQHGELGFAYVSDWLRNDENPPLSASLPKRAEPFNRRACRPVFGGLLPEEGQRNSAARALGVSRGNDWALLDRIGGDMAGALQFPPPGQPPTEPDPDKRAMPLEIAGFCLDKETSCPWRRRPEVLPRPSRRRLRRQTSRRDQEGLSCPMAGASTSSMAMRPGEVTGLARISPAKVSFHLAGLTIGLWIRSRMSQMTLPRLASKAVAVALWLAGAGTVWISPSSSRGTRERS